MVLWNCDLHHWHINEDYVCLCSFLSRHRSSFLFRNHLHNLYASTGVFFRSTIQGCKFHGKYSKYYESRFIYCRHDRVHISRLLFYKIKKKNAGDDYKPCIFHQKYNSKRTLTSRFYFIFNWNIYEISGLITNAKRLIVISDVFNRILWSD